MKDYIKRNRKELVLLFFLLCFLNLLYIPQCDELYYRSWKFKTAIDRLLSKPILEGDHIIGLIYNGRIIGNFIGVLQGQLLTTKLWWLRAPIFAIGIISLGLGMTRLSMRFKPKYFLISILPLICATRGIYQNVYSWGVAYINYFLPLLLFVFLYILLEEEKHSFIKRSALFLLAFIIQLFMESVTISMFFFSGYVLISKKIPSKNKLPVCIGIWAGCLIMFLYPSYQHVSSDGGLYAMGMDLNLIFNNLCEISYGAFFQHVILMLSISWLFLQNNKIHNRKYKASEIIKFVINVIIVAIANLLNRLNWGTNWINPILLGLIGISWLHSWIKLRNTAEWEKIGVFLFGSVILVAPFLLVQPSLFERMYYATYVMLILLMLQLLSKTDYITEKLNKCCIVPISIFLVLMIGIYGSNYAVNQWRISLGQEQISAGAESITLPLVPFEKYCINEHTGKGDLSFILYKDVPFDVQLKFVFYDDFLYGKE